jgi:hypothetical protein
MKRSLLTLLLCLVLFARAEAQTTQPELSFRFGVNLLVLPSLSFALEAREPRGGIGVRTSAFYFVAVYGYRLDAYVFVPLSDHWDVYFGAGWFQVLSALPFVNPTEFTYGLIGVRLRNGFFLEVNPGVFSTTGCATPAQALPCSAGRFFGVLGTLGFAWHF